MKVLLVPPPSGLEEAIGKMRRLSASAAANTASSAQLSCAAMRNTLLVVGAGAASGSLRSKSVDDYVAQDDAPLSLGGSKDSKDIRYELLSR